MSDVHEEPAVAGSDSEPGPPTPSGPPPDALVAEAPAAREDTAAPDPEGGSADSATSPEPRRPFTLAIDVGGTGLKASVLDVNGKMIADRVRIDTTYPLSPDDFVEAIATLVQPLPRADRASMGFPGVVRNGLVVTAPHFVTKRGPGSEVVPALLAAWSGFDVASRIGDRLSLPTRVLNDADLQGLAVVEGRGLELVVTFGTGVGTALFLNGTLTPHLELAHHPFRKGGTYNDQLGEAAFEKIGVKRWRTRAKLALETLYELVHYDHCFIGGGNARHLRDQITGPVSIVDNVAGILGGVKLWEDVPPSTT